MQLTIRKPRVHSRWHAYGFGMLFALALTGLGLIASQLSRPNKQVELVSSIVPAATETAPNITRKLPDLSRLGLLSLGQPLVQVQQIAASPYNTGGGPLFLSTTTSVAELPGVTDGNDQTIPTHLVEGTLDLTAEDFRRCSLKLYFWNGGLADVPETMMVIQLLPDAGQFDIQDAKAWILSRYDVKQMVILNDTEESFAVHDGSRSVYVNKESIRFIDGISFAPNGTATDSEPMHTMQSSTRAAPTLGCGSFDLATSDLY